MSRLSFNALTEIVLLLCVLALLLPYAVNGQPVENAINLDPSTNPLPDPASSDYQFQRSGIFGCNLTGAYSMSVGSLSAVGGVYVPVNDAAVTLNTGYITYKECVLDGVTKRMAEKITSDYARYGINAFSTARDGRPLFPEDLAADILERTDESRLHTLESGAFSALHPALQDQIVREVIDDYRTRTREATQSLACPYEGDLEAVWGGNTDDVFGGLMALTNPACNKLLAYHAAKDYADREDAARVNEMFYRLTTADGIYGVEEYDPVTGRYITRTPGILVAGNVAQLLQSGLRQLENATEIDQIVNSLFSGLSTHVIADSRGLSGLTQPGVGQPSYLDQLANEASRGLRESAANIALQILSSAKQVETQYLAIASSIANTLTQAINQLRAAEKECWNLVVENTCASPLSSSNSCTSVPPSSQLQVATSTARSQQVIDSQIAPLATQAITNVETSENALTLIDRLIVDVRNSSSLDVQRIALQRLDALVAQRALHNQNDLQVVTTQKNAVEAAIEDLVTDTVETWADSQTPTVGWCNVNNPDVIQYWIGQWRN